VRADFPVGSRWEAVRGEVEWPSNIPPVAKADVCFLEGGQLRLSPVVLSGGIHLNDPLTLRWSPNEVSYTEVDGSIVAFTTVRPSGNQVEMVVEAMYVTPGGHRQKMLTLTLKLKRKK
jgi:hypothetical protein